MLNLKLSVLSILTLTLARVNGQWNPNFVPGRTTMVHLFEWKWTDIERECKDFLGPFGYGGVQVSPPNENVIVRSGFNIYRPWWERYQPVSYKLETRSGTEQEFKNMVAACNSVGVRIYVDAVINHMSGQGSGPAQSTGGSDYDTATMTYGAVPYNSSDFHDRASCGTLSGEIVDYSSAQQVRNCKLSGLNDLDQSLPHVRERLVEYFNRLISYGVAGFRIDASKHMNPPDLKAIVESLDNLPTDLPAGFTPGSKPFIYQEVIDLGGEAITANDYVGHGRVTEFKFGKNLGDLFRKLNGQKLAYVRNFGEGWGFLSSRNALTFVDNHDNQRGHGAGGANILTFRAARLYKQAVAFMLAIPYGVTRVMSSYYWPQNLVFGKDLNDWIGPPHDSDFNILNVTIYPNFTCGNGWVCEHRWREIYEMVKFRNVVEGTGLNDWWDNGNNQIAFCRGGSGFIAINNDYWDMNTNVQACLPPGVYCDVISGGLGANGRCVGKSVTVGLYSRANIYISAFDENPIIAIHEESKQPSIFSTIG